MALNLTGLPIDNQLLSKVDAPLGTYRQSDLTESQFNETSLGEWALCDGRPCTGSGYHALTGKTSVPDATSQGAFFRQTSGGRSLGSYEEDAFQGHWHSFTLLSSSRSSGTSSNVVNASVGSATQNTRVRDAVTDGVNGTPEQQTKLDLKILLLIFS